jgi:hypothetical protein
MREMRESCTGSPSRVGMRRVGREKEDARKAEIRLAGSSTSSRSPTMSVRRLHRHYRQGPLAASYRPGLLQAIRGESSDKRGSPSEVRQCAGMQPGRGGRGASSFSSHTPPDRAIAQNRLLGSSRGALVGVMRVRESRLAVTILRRKTARAKIGGNSPDRTRRAPPRWLYAVGVGGSCVSSAGIAAGA